MNFWTALNKMAYKNSVGHQVPPILHILPIYLDFKSV